MGLTVYWTQFAEDKLSKVYSYYKEKAGNRIAQELVKGIVEKSLLLEENPQIGQIEPLLLNRPFEFRYLIHKSFKLIYRIDKKQNRIEIVNLFDCRLNPEKLKEK
jgi:toxin ParE1/3/4